MSSTSVYSCLPNSALATMLLLLPSLALSAPLLSSRTALSSTPSLFSSASSPSRTIAAGEKQREQHQRHHQRHRQQHPSHPSASLSPASTTTSNIEASPMSSSPFSSFKARRGALLRAFSSRRTVGPSQVKAVSTTKRRENVNLPRSAVATPPPAAPTEVKKYAKLFGFDVTLYGAYFMTYAISYGILWYMSLLKWLLLSRMSKGKWDPDNHKMDLASYVWAKRVLTSTGCAPIITGLENLPEQHGGTLPDDGRPLMIVANHASWMDVPVIRLITRKCKFLAKKDLGKVPILGTSLRWGHHPLVDRSDKRSTVKSFRQGVDLLKRGVSLVTFPEGTRSLDGRFSSAEALKGGAFKMAIYSGARIVPVSISGTFDVMPKTALFPLRPSNGRIRIQIHPPIETTKDMSENELTQKTHKIIASGLPPKQQPQS